MIRYKQIQDNEKFHIANSKPHRTVCCDCGLVHVIVPKMLPEHSAIEIVARRDVRATAYRRKKLGLKAHKVAKKKTASKSGTKKPKSKAKAPTKNRKNRRGYGKKA